jgi:hypothetical protein
MIKELEKAATEKSKFLTVEWRRVRCNGLVCVLDNSEPDIDVSMGILKTNQSDSGLFIVENFAEYRQYTASTSQGAGLLVWTGGGWVVSSVSELKTSVGGSRGFSGLGYVNVDEMLAVIHSGGGCISELS